LDENGFGQVKGKHATSGKTIFGDESKEQDLTEKQVKEDLKNDMVDEASDDVSKCSQMPEKDHIIYSEAAHQSDSAQQVTNETGFDESNWPHATPESDVVTSLTEVAEKATNKESKHPMVTNATMVDQREGEQHKTDEDPNKLECQQATQEGEATGMTYLREECAENKNVCETSLDRTIFQSSDSETELVVKRLFNYQMGVMRTKRISVRATWIPQEKMEELLDGLVEFNFLETLYKKKWGRTLKKQCQL
jgi:hypothetical protein